MDRPDATLIPADTAWLRDADVQAVLAALGAEGGAAYFVGGCVRDALLGKPGSDVDVATDCLPGTVMQLVEAAGLKAVPTGIDHGTVTVVSGGQAIEVTTFRRDVVTDGRHAEVVFSSDIAEDARRRDFTMNALYGGADGHVFDPLGGGVADCLARRIRFIDDADQRIREDYLRILRFFRFQAWYAPPHAGFDPETLNAIARNTPGLETLSAERIGAETLRLLAAPDPTAAVAALQQTGGLARILPGADPVLLGPMVQCEKMLVTAPDPIARLAALGGEDPVARLRLSRQQAKRWQSITHAAWDGPSPPEIAYRSGADIALSAALLRAAAAGTPPDPGLIATLDTAASRTFPVEAADLMPGHSGKALGDRLRHLEDRWLASGFVLTREELLALP